MKKRIWELDAFRGLALMGMIGIHLIYDLVDLFGVIHWQQPVGYLLFKNNYGLLFLIISGISVTLGRRSVKRGLQVFCCGFLCTAVTAGMYFIGMTDSSIIIYYGVLQCLGTCMMLWPLFKKLPNWALVGLGLSMVAVGLWLRGRWFDSPALLIPIGIAPWWFASSDYFPLLPNLGYFLLGAVIGRTLYRTKESRLPESFSTNEFVRFLRYCGEHSLMIYLLHQPILGALVGAVAYLQ